MKKGFRDQLIKISRDGYAKRKKLGDALTNEELDFIKENDALATEFIEQMMDHIRTMMESENNGKIYLKVDGSNIKCYTVPVHYTYFFGRGKYIKPSILLRNLCLYLRDVEGIKFDATDHEYTLFIE